LHSGTTQRVEASDDADHRLPVKLKCDGVLKITFDRPGRVDGQQNSATCA
jgi:hypothetical protein